MTTVQLTNHCEKIYEKKVSIETPPIQVNERVVWLPDSGPEYGTVRWVGILPDVGDDWTVGVELDNDVGNSNGSWCNRQLFTTKPKHGLIIPANGLIRKDEFLGKINADNSSSQLLMPLSPNSSQRPINNFINEDLPLSVGERIVCLINSRPQSGVIQWIGSLPNNPEIVANVKFDTPFVSGTNAYNSFPTSVNHASFIPIANLSRENEFRFPVNHVNDVSSNEMNHCLKRVSGNYDNIDYSTNNGPIKRKIMNELPNGMDENGKHVAGNKQPTVLALQLAADIASGNIANSVLKDEPYDHNTENNTDLDKWYDAIDFSAAYSLNNKSLLSARSLESVSNTDETSSLSSLKSSASDKSSKEGSSLFSFFRWFGFRKNKKKQKSKSSTIDTERMRANSAPSVTSLSDSFHYVPVNFGPLQKINEHFGALTSKIKKNKDCPGNTLSEANQVLDYLAPNSIKIPKNNSCDQNSEPNDTNSESLQMSSGVSRKAQSLNPKTLENHKVLKNSTNVQPSKIYRRKKRRAPSPPHSKVTNEYNIRMNTTLPANTHFKHDSTISPRTPLSKRYVHVKGKRRAPSPPLNQVVMKNDKVSLDKFSKKTVLNVDANKGIYDSNKSETNFRVSVEDYNQQNVQKSKEISISSNISVTLPAVQSLSVGQQNDLNNQAVFQHEKNESCNIGKETTKELLNENKEELPTSLELDNVSGKNINGAYDGDINEKMGNVVSKEWKNRNRSTQKLIDMFNALTDLAKVTDQLTYETNNPMPCCLQTNSLVSFPDTNQTNEVISNVQCQKNLGIAKKVNSLTFYLNSSCTETVKLEITKSSDKINSFSSDSTSQSENISNTLVSTEVSSSESSESTNNGNSLLDNTVENDIALNHTYENVDELRMNLQIPNDSKYQKNQHKESSFNWYKKFPHQQLDKEQEDIPHIDANGKINGNKQVHDLNQKMKFSKCINSKHISENKSPLPSKIGNTKNVSSYKKNNAPDIPSLNNNKEKTGQGNNSVYINQENLQPSPGHEINNNTSLKNELIIHNGNLKMNKNICASSSVHGPVSNPAVAQSLISSSSSLSSNSSMYHPLSQCKNDKISLSEKEISFERNNNGASNSTLHNVETKELKLLTKIGLGNKQKVIDVSKKHQAPNAVYHSSHSNNSIYPICHSTIIDPFNFSSNKSSFKEISLLQKPFSSKAKISEVYESENKNIQLTKYKNSNVSSVVAPIALKHNNQNMLKTNDFHPSVNADIFISQPEEACFQMDQGDNLCIKPGKKISLPASVSITSNEIPSSTKYKFHSSDNQHNSASGKSYDILIKRSFSPKGVATRSYQEALWPLEDKKIGIDDITNKKPIIKKYGRSSEITCHSKSHQSLNDNSKPSGNGVEIQRANNLPDDRISLHLPFENHSVDQNAHDELELKAGKHISSGTCLNGSSDESLVSNTSNNGTKSLSNGEEFLSKLWPPLYEIVAPELVHLKAKFVGCSTGKEAEESNDIEVNKILRQLELAISEGHCEQASRLARKLAMYKVSCSIVRKKPKQKPTSQEEISVNIFVEDRFSHLGPFILYVKPLMNVGELKKLVEKQFEFPALIQRWILGKKLATDDEASLLSYGIDSDGCPVYLYLMTSEVEKMNINRKRLSSYLDALEKLEEEEEEDYEDAYSEMDKGVICVAREAPISRIVENDVLVTSENKFKENHQSRVTQEEETIGWNCPTCTFINVPTRPGCEQCATDRPQDYEIPTNYKLSAEEQERIRREKEEEEEAERVREEERLMNYNKLVETEEMDLIVNPEPFDCPICYTACEKGDGIVLRDCLHTFCRECLSQTIEHSEIAEVKCPFMDENYSCQFLLQEREIRMLVSPDVYDKHLQRSVATAESQAENSFHCKTADCRGWCIYEDDINEFLCPVCNHTNCLTCQAIHENMNCRQYQDKVMFESAQNDHARKDREYIENMLQRAEAMYCPRCRIIIMKKWGCDWLQCSMCRTEICWVTKQARWGPKGHGDTSGGCRCGVNGRKCHPNCRYCH